MKIKLFIIFLGFMICFPAQVQAKASKKKRVVDIDFDDELRIKGKLLGPSLFTLFQKKNINYGKLIKPRKHFLPEMRETAQDIE